jgi:hypothetical protein
MQGRLSLFWIVVSDSGSALRIARVCPQLFGRSLNIGRMPVHGLRVRAARRRGKARQLVPMRPFPGCDRGRGVSVSNCSSPESFTCSKGEFSKRSEGDRADRTRRAAGVPVFGSPFLGARKVAKKRSLAEAQVRFFATDRHGFTRMKTGKDRSGFTSFLPSSVFISVHLWLKRFSVLGV